MRVWGNPPYCAALIHGGPGAAGEMHPVAMSLAATFSILEPMQTRDNISLQVDELRLDLARHTSEPICLVGFSWGAWLASIFAARYPERVSKLILVSAGSYSESYAAGIDDLRISRLPPDKSAEIPLLMTILRSKDIQGKKTAFSRLGELFEEADTFASIDKIDALNASDIRPDIFEKVWPEAAVMRASGELLNIASNIKCPVVAIHGDYDTHIAAGVREPLSEVLKDFRFELLEKCGHKPWMERYARDRFFMILRKELAEIL